MRRISWGANEQGWGLPEIENSEEKSEEIPFDRDIYMNGMSFMHCTKGDKTLLWFTESTYNPLWRQDMQSLNSSISDSLKFVNVGNTPPHPPSVFPLPTHKQFITALLLFSISQLESGVFIRPAFTTDSQSVLSWRAQDRRLRTD